MWVQGEDDALAESDGGSDLSSGDDGDIQCEILEMQRDEANQRLSELEQVSSQLLKEINVLEIQFQIERSCRESAEALAVKITKENRVLKRTSQMLMPLISEWPENEGAAVTFDPESDPAANCDVVDLGEGGGEEDGGDEDRGDKDGGDEDDLLLESQSRITDLQASVDRLLAEKLQLEQQVEDLSKELVQVREQLVLEAEDKEATLRAISKQSRAMSKIKRVSQLVTEEFTAMSQKLELEQGLRQHAEVFAHQIMERRTPPPPLGWPGSPGLVLQLQQALEQIAAVAAAMGDIQRRCRDEVKEKPGADELQDLREQLEKSEEQRRASETRLSEVEGDAAKLQEEVKQLQDKLTNKEKTDEPEEKPAQPTPPPPPPPPPPPLPPPPPPTAVSNPLDLLRSRRMKAGAGRAEQTAPVLDVKTQAVNEMMERIKRGIVLKPIVKIQESESSWQDQRSENRKSAILELKGMLDSMKRQTHRRVPSRRGIGRNVGEVELLQVLQRRRRAMGESRDLTSSAQSQDPQPGAQSVPDVPWAGGSGGAPVLRRLRQNREKRDSRLRASAWIVNQDDDIITESGAV